MKHLLLLLTVVLMLGAFQNGLTQTVGYLTEGDSIVVVDPEHEKVVEIFLVDSSSTADTCIVEVLNPINNTWITLRVIDQSTGNGATLLIPGVSVTGKMYTVPLEHPATLRLRKTDVANRDETVYYYLRVR